MERTSCTAISPRQGPSMCSNAWPRAEEGFDTWQEGYEHTTDLLTVREAMEAEDEAMAMAMQ